jgi:hypothetical protein
MQIDCEVFQVFNLNKSQKQQQQQQQQSKRGSQGGSRRTSGMNHSKSNYSSVGH